MRSYRAERVFTGRRVWRDAVVEVEAGGVIRQVRPATSADGPAVQGWLLPGLVNAHTHLELAWARGKVAGGGGLAAWVAALMSLEVDDQRRVSEARATARQAYALGTAAVCDISGRGDTAPLWIEAGVGGLVQYELMGLDRAKQADLLAAASLPSRIVGDDPRVVVRPTAHGLYSTRPQVVRAALAPRGAVGSIHAAEDVDELRFLEDLGGPLAAFVAGLARDICGFEAPGARPIQVLDTLGVLGPDLLVVHGVHLTADERSSLASSGTSLCLCPRSNLHIGGGLPAVPELLEAGVRLCVGTDSLASSADMDLLGEVAVLAGAFPEVELEIWLELATASGAEALGLERYGRLERGCRPGLLWIQGDGAMAELAAAPRSWLVEPDGSSEVAP